MKRFLMGVDLGQVSDSTAISITDERVDKLDHTSPIDSAFGVPRETLFSRKYLLRYLERPPLGTPYTSIVKSIKELIDRPQVRGNIDLVVDATGVGRPVIDIMHDEGLNPIPIVITFGQVGKAVEMDDDGYYRVPKVDIMSALQVLFGSKRLKYPAELKSEVTGENLLPVWLLEMERFKMKQTEAKNTTYEAWRESDHDDIVLSIAIQCWWILFSRPKDVSKSNLFEPEEDYNPHSYLKPVLRRR